VTIHDQRFDQKWIQKKEPLDEVILGNTDPTSLIDLGRSFTIIRQMGLVPIDKPTSQLLCIGGISAPPPTRLTLKYQVRLPSFKTRLAWSPPEDKTRGNGKRAKPLERIESAHSQTVGWTLETKIFSASGRAGAFF